MVQCLNVGTSSELGLDEDSDPDLDSALNKPLQLVRCTIDCSAYTEFKLRPITDVELPEPGPDGSANFRALSSFGLAEEDDWRMREGGILYVI